MAWISLVEASWRQRRSLGLVFFGALLLSGCGTFGSRTDAPTAMPTRTPVPTYTATPVQVAAVPTPAPPAAPQVTPTVAVVSAPSTLEPTPGPVLTSTQQSASLLTVAADFINIRSGPGTDYAVVGTANTGASFPVVGRSSAGDWWEICCVNEQNGWVFGELATVTGGDSVPMALDLPADTAPAQAVVAATVPPPPATAAPAAPSPAAQAAAAAAPPDPNASSAGFFDSNAQYQIVHFKVLGLDENNGGIRDSSAQHLIFLTVLDQNGAGVDGAVVKNLVGEKGDFLTGSKGPGRAEIPMYWEPFKLTVASDATGLVTSQVSNQMGLAFPHLPDLVGKLGDVNYEYGACPTLEIRCQWPIQAIHFSYEITFQKVK